MTFKELPAGRYPCRITDWSLSEVEKLDNALKVTIQLAVKRHDADEVVTGWWEGLVKTKDGKINEKTLKALLSSGFSSIDIYALTSDTQALDTTKDMEVTVVKDDAGRTKAEWLNSAGGGSLKKEPLVKKKDLTIEAALGKALKEKGVKKKVKNFAPQATNEVEEDLGF